MSAPAEKFNPEAYKREMQEYVKYLKCSWELALEVAEGCIGPPAQPDDAEAVDVRQAVIYDMAARIFDKICFDVRDVLAQAYWQKQGGE